MFINDLFLQGSRSALCDDSDSDLEDFYHVLDESSNQLKVTDHALQKKKKRYRIVLEYWPICK